MSSYIPKHFTVDSSVIAEYDRLQQQRLERATRNRKAEQIKAILHYRSNGMSDRRLTQIYGPELLRAAINAADVSS